MNKIIYSKVCFNLAFYLNVNETFSNLPLFIQLSVAKRLDPIPATTGRRQSIPWTGCQSVSVNGKTNIHIYGPRPN